jgi:molybdopterin molybdotransferase
MHLGLLASVERSEVTVSAKPHCTILCTGDELRAPGAPGPPGSLAESNSPALVAFIEAVGATAVRAPIVFDRLEEMKQALVSARDESNLIITVGGVSVGDHDLVAPALEALGAEIYFHKVRIKPGKPVLFGRLGNALVLGLPGNPSSAQVTFALFGGPLLRALSGSTQPIPKERWASLSHDFSQKPGRRGFYRARVDGDSVELFANQASGASTAMAWGNALAIVDEEQSELGAGTKVPILGYSDLWG